MKPKINFITLPVEDLEKSVKFYESAFGFTIAEKSSELCLFELNDNFYLTLQQKNDFLKQTSADSDTLQVGGFILSHVADSKDEVSEITSSAEESGAKKLNTLDEDWGFSITLKNPDGHIWEILCHYEK